MILGSFNLSKRLIVAVKISFNNQKLEEWRLFLPAGDEKQEEIKRFSYRQKAIAYRKRKHYGS